MANADRFTNATADASRVYFRADKSEPLTLRLRLKPVGTAVVTAYLNGEALPATRLSGNEFKDYDVAIPAERVQAGENRLMLRFGGSTLVNGEQVAAAVASIRLIPASEAAVGKDYDAPHYAELHRNRSWWRQSRALAVPSSTTLSFYSEVPASGALGFGVGVTGDKPKSGKASVVVTPEGGQPKELFSTDLATSWKDQVVSLDAYAGKVVRIELRATGDVGAGRVAWSTRRCFCPKRRSRRRPRRPRTWWSS